MDCWSFCSYSSFSAFSFSCFTASSLLPPSDLGHCWYPSLLWASSSFRLPSHSCSQPYPLSFLRSLDLDLLPLSAFATLEWQLVCSSVASFTSIPQSLGFFHVTAACFWFAFDDGFHCPFSIFYQYAFDLHIGPRWASAYSLRNTWPDIVKICMFAPPARHARTARRSVPPPLGTREWSQ